MENNWSARELSGRITAILRNAEEPEEPVWEVTLERYAVQMNRLITGSLPPENLMDEGFLGEMDDRARTDLRERALQWKADLSNKISIFDILIQRLNEMNDAQPE